MLDQQVLQFLNCCIALPENNHFAEDSIALRCGHYLCRTCLESVSNKTNIKCNICNTTDNRPLEQQPNVSIVNALIQQNIEELMKCVFDRFNTSLSKLIDIYLNSGEYLNTKIEFIKEEITIRIESLKIALDKIGEELCLELDKIKQDESEIKLDCEINLKSFESEINSLKDAIELKQNLNGDELFKQQNKIKEVRKYLNEIEKKQTNIIIEINNTKLEKSIIGKIRCLKQRDIDCDKINKAIQKQMYETKDVSHCADGLCATQNGYLIVSDYKIEELYIYNEDFKLIKTVNRIDNQNFSPVGLDSCKDGIYIADNAHHKILKTDLDFNFLCSSIDGQSLPEKMKNPCGLCYYQEVVYACDWQNKRIFLFNATNLEFQKSFKFDYSVWYIKIHNDVACVRDNLCTGIYFYDMPDFIIKHKYDGHNGIIGSISNYFYEYDYVTQRFFCYNYDGTIKENFDYSVTNLFINRSCTGELVFFNSKLVIGANTAKKLITF